MNATLVCEMCSADVIAIAHTVNNGKICLDCVAKTHTGFSTQITKLVLA